MMINPCTTPNNYAENFTFYFLNYKETLTFMCLILDKTLSDSNYCRSRPERRRKRRPEEPRGGSSTTEDLSMLSRLSDARRDLTPTPKYIQPLKCVILPALSSCGKYFLMFDNHISDEHNVSHWKRLRLHTHGGFGLEQRQGSGKAGTGNCGCAETKAQV